MLVRVLERDLWIAERAILIQMNINGLAHSRGRQNDVRAAAEPIVTGHIQDELTVSRAVSLVESGPVGVLAKLCVPAAFGIDQHVLLAGLAGKVHGSVIDSEGHPCRRLFLFLTGSREKGGRGQKRCQGIPKYGCMFHIHSVFIIVLRIVHIPYCQAHSLSRPPARQGSGNTCGKGGCWSSRRRTWSRIPCARTRFPT